MRGIRRSHLAVVLAAVLLVLLVPLAPATADRSHGHAKGHADHHKRFNALIFTKTAAFRHTECIPQGTVAIAQMAARAWVRGRRDGERRSVHRREPGQVRRRDLPVHDR